MNLKIVIPIILLSVNLLTAQTTAIPDPNFEQALIDLGYDSGMPDGSLLTANIEAVTDLNISSKNITSLIGIKDFEKLETLNCNKNALTNLDVSQNILLTALRCEENELTSLDVTENTLLTNLFCRENAIISLDVSQNTLLTTLSCGSNALTSLDVSQNTLLTVLSFWFNELTSIDITQNTLLTFFSCGANELTSLDVTQNTLLDYLSCGANELTSLDVTENTLLTFFWCAGNELTSLDVTQNTLLDDLRCSFNALTSLDVSQNTLLTDFDCRNNNLMCLNLRNGNNMDIVNFDATSNPDLQCIEVDDPIWSASNWTDIDATATFNTECNELCITSNNNVQNNLTDIKIYPNPNTGSFTIQLNKTVQELDVELINELGQKVFAETFHSTTIINYNIDIPKGIYFLHLQLNSGESKVVKMVMIE